MLAEGQLAKEDQRGKEGERGLWVCVGWAGGMLDKSRGEGTGALVFFTQRLETAGAVLLDFSRGVTSVLRCPVAVPV